MASGHIKVIRQSRNYGGMAKERCCRTKSDLREALCSRAKPDGFDEAIRVCGDIFLIFHLSRFYENKEIMFKASRVGSKE